MAIRFDKNYNAKIDKVVRNFNQKVNRLTKRGFTHLPDTLTVSELKSRYEKRKDLNRELRFLTKFTADEGLKTIETSGGVKAIKWEYDYLKKNIKYAKDYYDREIAKLAYLDTPMQVAKSEYLNNLKVKRYYLDRELNELTQPQFSTYKSIVNESIQANYVQSAKYRGWLNEVETIMRQLGYDNQTINKFFEGFDKLTPHQFITMYRQSNLISRIYELYIPSKEDGDFRLSTSEEDARNLIDTVMTEKDEMIRKAKETEKQMQKGLALEKFTKETENFKEEKVTSKLKRSELSDEQIKQLEELGWDDLIE